MSWWLANLAELAIAPFLLLGAMGRVKSWWSGRKGPPLLQPWYDVLRLARKRPVYSVTTSPMFRLGPQVFLLSSLGAAVIAPVLGARPLVSFQFDFVWFAYVWALGRVAVMLAALDVGSSFEGMGAAREALFSSLLEPVLFLTAGALSFVSGQRSLHQLLSLHVGGGAPLVVWVLSVLALLIVVQVEASRVPADDPSTHLELTMVHEVMVLDHSGPDLAVIQAGAALKLFVGCSLLATLLNPWSGKVGAWTAAVNLALSFAVAVLLATIESLIARFKLRAVPLYISVALGCAGVALLATIWRAGVER